MQMLYRNKHHNKVSSSIRPQLFRGWILRILLSQERQELMNYKVIQCPFCRDTMEHISKYSHKHKHQLMCMQVFINIIR